MDMQNVSNLTIPEGNVRTIHDKNSRLLWGKLSYDTKYKGDSSQQTYAGKNLFDPSAATNNKLLIWTTGNYNDNTGSVVSDYIAVAENTKIQLTYLAAVFFYDSSKNLIGHFGSNQQIVTTSGGAYYNSFTVPSGYSIAYIRLNLRASQGTNPSNLVGLDTMINTGDTLLPYEPYTNGIPAPSPSYPMPISVVTGEQTVTVSGKNLFNWAGLVQNPGDYANATLNEWNTNGVIITGNASTGAEFATSRGIFRPTASNTNSAFRVHLPDNATVTISADVTLLENNYTPKTRIILDPGGTLGSAVTLTLNEKNRISQTFTNVAEGFYRPVFSLNSNKLKIENIQIEINSAATPYESFQSQSYTVSLGSTELCKIGTYQDYIYKSGGDWYVHKAIDGFVANGSENWNKNGSSRQDLSIPNIMRGSASNNPVISSRYISRFSTSVNNSVFLSGAANALCVYDTIHATGASTWTSWLSSNNTTFYYALATPTDTKITDATLIGQLDAIHQFLTRYGYNSNVSGNLPLIIDKTNL